MIWKLTVCLEFGVGAEDPWSAEIEIEETDTLADLHRAIQKAVRFEDDHLFSFFYSRRASGAVRTYLQDDREQKEDFEFNFDSLTPAFSSATKSITSIVFPDNGTQDDDDVDDDDDDDDDDFSVDYENGGQTFSRRICDTLPAPSGRRLFYLFDWGDEWLFSITKPRQKPQQPVPSRKYPRTVSQQGKRPKQYPHDE